MTRGGFQIEMLPRFNPIKFFGSIRLPFFWPGVFHLPPLASSWMEK